MNTHLPNPRPMANEPIAMSAAPPAPTGAITLPIQLIRFRKVPSGLRTLLTLDGHVDLRGRSQILGHQTRLNHQDERRQRDHDTGLPPPRILRHRDYLLLSSPLGDERKIARFENSRKRMLLRHRHRTLGGRLQAGEKAIQRRCFWGAIAVAA